MGNPALSRIVAVRDNFRVARDPPGDHDDTCRFARVPKASTNLGWRRLCLSCSQMNHLVDSCSIAYPKLSS
jgi:hypothetical protein